MSMPKGTIAKRMMVWGLVFQMMLPPLPVLADMYVAGKGLYKNSVTPPAANALPQPRNIGADQAVLEKPGDNKLVVHQKKDKAILEWNSFDIGSDAWTHFDQKGRTDWSALNRIYDQNPSLIFGRLTADGKVFLVNQNGMIFGPGARIQAHDLVASALDIDNQDFLNDALKFKSNDYIDNPGQAASADATVANQGAITVDRNGTVYLLGPRVENSGTIDAPAGQVELAAAEKLEFYYSTPNDTKRLVKTTEGALENPGEVINHESGRISADTGRAELFGRVVNQEGLITSVVTLESSGEIFLKATERVTTGEQSTTQCPISQSSQKLNRSFDSAKEYKGTIQVNAPLIEHKGAIVAPSGEVTFTAEPTEEISEPRILLDSRSVLDVSGESADLKAQDRVATVQLNSIQLRDDYGQKEGALKGETIAFDTRRGSAVGNVSEAVANQPQSALEKNAAGGKIYLQAQAGDIIQKQGAAVTFKGGRINYAAGPVETTKLVAGRKVYDISEAPQWLTYDRVLGSYEKRYERFGVVKSYADGPYLGGGTIVKGGYSPAYSQGADAGTLTLEAKRVVLDGTLDGSVFVGPYQSRSEEVKDLSDNEVTAGLRRPSGGNLVIGYDESSGSKLDPNSRDQYLQEAVITAERTALNSDFGINDTLPAATLPGALSAGASLIPAELLNTSGLERIQIFANTRIATEQGAEVLLPVGGQFKAAARSIEHLGSLKASAGDVTLIAIANTTSTGTYDGLAEGIYLGSQSAISVAGLCADYSQGLPAEAAIHPGQNQGGTITLHDENYVQQLYGAEQDRSGRGVLMASGASLDVSGGYTLTAGGKLNSGNAGKLDLAGSTLILDGRIAGRSLPGAEGGELSLHARDVRIQAQAAGAVAIDPNSWDIDDPGRVGRLILSPSELAATGFSKVSIRGEGGLTVAGDARLAPSYAKNSAPTPSRMVPGYYTQAAFRTELTRSDGLVYLPAGLVAETSKITLGTGKKIANDNPSSYAGALDIEKGVQLAVAPEGQISLEGPTVNISGELQAQGGTIAVQAGTVNVLAGGRLDVSGTVVPDDAASAVAGLPAGYTALAAGSVKLSADFGIAFADQAVVDLSGSRPARYYQLQADRSIRSATAAGDPGSLELSYYTTLAIAAGNIEAERYQAGLPGASLSIHRASLTEGLDVATLGLQAGASGKGLLAAGFDALTLQSDHSLIFSGHLDVALARRLTLDAPVLTASGELQVAMQAPWIQLTNTYDQLSPSAPGVGGATLRLTARGLNDQQGQGWLDVTGNLLLSGFKQVDLESAGDMVFADASYLVNAKQEFSGALATAGRLDLRADQIYPATAADFTLAAPEIIAIHRFDDTLADNALVDSAGGRLVLESSRIDNYGRILAPMGAIVVRKGTETVNVDGVATTVDTPADQVYLAQGSLISVKADHVVNYGALSDAEVESSWQLNKGESSNVTAAPEKQLRITADEIVQREEAVIDGSGGGQVFAYGWLAGVEGSVDPLSVKGRMVILPGAATALPGAAVYLKGGAGLAEGVYTILPDRYAFLPGAMILESQGESRNAGLPGHTIEGYNIVQGFRTVAGTDLQGGRLIDYTVRPAAEVLAQGHYTKAFFNAGDGGTISLSGQTTILSGTILAKGEAGHVGGTLAISGRDILLQETPTILGADFDPDASMADQTNLAYAALKDQLHIAATAITDTGFERIRIGSVAYDEEDGYTGTQTITIGAGSRLNAKNLELAAIGTIQIQGSGAGESTLLSADGDQGTLELSSRGQVELQDGATLNAVSAIVFDAPNLSLNGDMQVENSTIALRGDHITFADTDGAGGNSGLTITPELWAKISGNETVELLSRSDVRFDIQSPNGATWAADDLLRIDAARLVNISGQSADVTLNARTIQLRNTAGTASQTPAGNAGGTLAFSAASIDVGHGDLRADGFQSVVLTAASPDMGAGRTPGYITFRGKGGLTTDGALNLAADAVRTDLYRWTEPDGSSRFEAADFQVAAGSHLSIEPGASTTALAADAYAGLPGTLSLSADQVRITGAILMPAGKLSITAQNDIAIGSGAEIYLAGDARFAGGALQLTGTGVGNVNFGAGADIDLDAGTQGDAGRLDIIVADGAVTLDGRLHAHADGGAGGMFNLDAARIGNLDTLLGAVQNSGFTNSVAVRTSRGDLTVGAGTQRVQVAADQIKFAAYGGSLTIANADLNAGTAGVGGRIALYAGGDPNDPDAPTSGNVELGAGALLATGTGGRIEAASARGQIDMAGGARMRTPGGTVHFRARREGDTAGIALAGTIDGAAAVLAEAVAVYDGTRDTDVYAGGDLNDLNIDRAVAQARTFLENTEWAAHVRDDEGLDVAVRLIPGIEFQGSADVSINDRTDEEGVVHAIDLSAVRFAAGGQNVAGTLTIRAAGDLTLNTVLADDAVDTTAGSWDLHLAAGADLNAADLFVTNADGQGALHLNRRLFSYAGAVGFASAGDTTIVAPSVGAPSMITSVRGLAYSVASYSGGVRGQVGGDLDLQAGIVQSATGAIDLSIGGDLNFNNPNGGPLDAQGAIRTTGRPDGAPDNYVWAYTGGGPITVRVEGDINGAGLLVTPSTGVAATTWDTFARATGAGADRTLHYTASYNYFNGDYGTQGIAAMAGGAVSLQAGGDIACQVGTFGTAAQGGGDLEVFSGGDVIGRYLVREGQGALTALGNIGGGTKPTTLELCEADAIEAVAVGTVAMDALLNPTLFAGSTASGTNITNDDRSLSYGRESGVRLVGIEGDIRLLGNEGYYLSTQENDTRETILPPALDLRAGGDIFIGQNFLMAPSAEGNLSLVAGGSISGPSGLGNGIFGGAIDMVDLDAEALDALYAPGADLRISTINTQEERASLLHAGDTTPIIISAGENIENVAFTLPKQALIVAGNDIVDINYVGQNMGADDFSLIHAGRDIRLGVDPKLITTTQDGLTIHNTGIDQGGAGTLLVQAGRTLDLGTSRGIEASGNKANKALADRSAVLAVAAGYDLFESFAENAILNEADDIFADFDDDALTITAGLPVFFDQIRDSGRTYSQLLAEERKSEAEAFVARFREAVLYRLFSNPGDDAEDEYGDINMINSKIKTVDNSAGLYVIAAGDINVGRSTLPKATANGAVQRESGIFTESGGAINIYAAGNRHVDSEGNLKVSGNINVNESRIMTFLGGDITIWADQGDINAGRGSKGALIKPEPETIVSEGGDRVQKFKAPVTGSGVKTLTYDPDGPAGPQQAAKAGDGYIFAPVGEIDAGEAGISVENIYLAAVTYANVQNIEVAGLSVGMPVMVDTGANMGGLMGSNDALAQVMDAGAESIGASAKERMDQAIKSINENLVKLLNVEVVGFGDAVTENDKEKKDKE